MLAAMNDAILDEIYERSHGRQLTVAMLRGMLKQFFVEAKAREFLERAAALKTPDPAMRKRIEETLKRMSGADTKTK